jgi:hypothetical protein
MITLQEVLSDISKELGETTTNSTTRRIQHANDAIVGFANEKKWPFLIKEDTSLVSESGTQEYNIPVTVLADIRLPGGIKEITLGDSTEAILPMDWADRGNSKYDNGNFFYLNPEQTKIYFKKELTTAEAFHIHYYYIPERIDDVAEDFPIPSRYRKAIGLLGASNVQFSRYLEQQGNRLFNLYSKEVRNISSQQSETNTGKPRSFPHYLAWRGGRFKRR